MKVHFITIKVCIVWRGHRLLNVPLVGKKSPRNYYSLRMRLVCPKGITPWKINMEPENHLFDMGNHLPKLHFFGLHVSFQGCIYLQSHCGDGMGLLDHQSYEYSREGSGFLGTVRLNHLKRIAHLKRIVGGKVENCWIFQGNQCLPDSHELSFAIKGTPAWRWRSWISD